MWRTVVSLIAGFVAAGLVVFALGSFGDALFPPAPLEGQPPTDMMSTVPFGGQVFLVLSWALASVAGGAMAGFMAQERVMAHALGIGLVLQAMGLVRIVVFDHPMWMMIAVLLVFLPPAALGGVVGQRLLDRETANKAN